MGEVITYDRLYEILRKEKYETELQKLEKDFFKKVVEYINEKNNIFESQKNKDSIFSKESGKTKKQIENAIRILRELYERRESKIIQLALFSSRTENDNLSNCLDEEKEFFNEIKINLDRFRKGLLQNIIEGKLPKIEQPKAIKRENEDETKLVRFLYEVPKFVGDDLNIYGPFNREQIANLPKKIADILINKKRVEIL